jgi:tetratricopeptide (TPR) repeat protein
MNNLQALYFTQGRFVDAEPLALRVLEGRRRVLGAGHPDTINATHNLATVYDGLHQYDRAEPLFHEALDEHRRVQGPQHPSPANTLFALGKMYAAQGRYRDAELALVEAYDVRLQAYGSEHPSTQEVVLTLTQLYTEARDPQKTAEWRGKLTTDAARHDPSGKLLKLTPFSGAKGRRHSRTRRRMARLADTDRTITQPEKRAAAAHGEQNDLRNI